MIALFYDWVQYVYETLHGTSGVLKVFEDFGQMFATLYDNSYFSALIAVIMTLGTAVCVIYFLLEIADKMTEKMLSLEQLFVLLLRLVLAVLLINQCVPLLKGFIQFGDVLMAELNDANIATTLFDTYGDDIRDAMEDIGKFAAVGYAMKLIIPYLIVLVSNVVVYFIAISRSIELTIRMIFAPLAVANIYHDMQRSEGFRYMKKVLALSLQSAVCLGICIATSAVLQNIGGDPEALLTVLEAGELDIEIFLNQYVLGGTDYMLTLGILLARVGLMTSSMKICNDIVGV